MIQVKPTDKLVFDLEMNQIDYNEQKKESLRLKIAEKYGVPVKNVEINFKPLLVNKNGEKITLTSDVIKNIQDPKFQLELFKEYIDLKGIEDVDFEEIKTIDEQVNSFIDFDAYSKYKTYKFKYVKWDNYLSYGKGNYFDFTKLNGLVLLNGQPENQCGKTTFAIDLLRFALFGKANKSPNLDSVFNVYLPEETEVLVEACIEIDGIDYVIKRTITRPPLKKRTKKSKCKQTIEYYKIINGNYELIENCEGESTTQTNNIIREAVGSVDDFNLVISATAYSLGDLLRMGQTDKGKLFSRWLGLLSIEKKEEIAKNLWKNTINPKLLSNTYNKQKLQEEIEDYNYNISNNLKEITNLTSNENKSLENINSLNKEMLVIINEKKHIKEELTKIDITTLDNNILQLNNELTNKRAQFKSLKDEYLQIKDVVFEEDKLNILQKEYDENVIEINKIKEKNAEIRTMINVLREDNKRINDLISKKICPTCSHEIVVDEQNKLIEVNKVKEKQLIQEGVNNKNKIDELENKNTDISKNIEIIKGNKEIVYNRSKIELKLTALKTNIDNLKLQIKQKEDIKKEIEENRENILKNNEIDLKISNINISINNELKIKEECIRSIEGLKKDNIRYNEEIEKRNLIINKLNEEEKIIRNWNIYQELIGKNGIVKIILRKALPIINNEIDRILNGLCDFKVILNISDDNKVCIDLVRAGERLDLGTCASGFETVVSSLAIRHSLAAMATISKPNMLVLDEVLEGVGVSNYDKIQELYKRILCGYNFIIHITHNELITDWHNQIITVTKENNVSVIMK